MASNTPCLPGLFLGDTNTFGYHDDVGEAARFTFITDVYQKNTNELIVTDQKNHCLRKIERWNGIAEMILFIFWLGDEMIAYSTLINIYMVE